MNEKIIALGSQKLPDGGKGAKGDDAQNGSKPSEALKDLNDFVGARELLRSVDNAIEKVLRQFNEAARVR